MKKLILLALVFIVVLSGCKTGSQFTSRRYMKGHYAAKTHHKNKLKAIERNDVDSKMLASTGKKEIVKSTPSLILESEKPTKKDLVAAKPDRAKKTTSSIKKKNSGSGFLQNMQYFSQFIDQPLLLTSKNKAITLPKTETKGGGVDNSALIGTVCGGLGIVFDIMAFILTVGTFEYMFMLLFILGVAFGICGIIFGAKGMKNYRNERKTSSLVLGIVGVATGAISIFLAAYFAIYSLLILATY